EPDASTVELFRKLREKRLERPISGSKNEPARSARYPVGRLPVARTRLIGRTEAMNEVRARIVESPLVTLSGTGGIGKTRLGLETAAALDGEFAHGAAFVALASLANETAVPDAILRALGGRAPESSAPIVEALCEYLAPRQQLLVLDNCEHLL